MITDVLSSPNHQAALTDHLQFKHLQFYSRYTIVKAQLFAIIVRRAQYTSTKLLRKFPAEDRSHSCTKSFLTNGNCESAMEKTIAQWNVLHCTLGKWNFLFGIT